MGLARQFNQPGWFLTGSELLLFWLVTLAALVLSVAVASYLLVIAAAAWAAGLYRSGRHARAVRRAGLTGFVLQAARVGDEERERKVAAIRRELGDWQPGLRWLADVDARAAGR